MKQTCVLLLLLVAAVLTASGKRCPAGGVLDPIGQHAEWEVPAAVLVHTPNSGGELTVPALHAASALFEMPLDPQAVAADHRAFIGILQSHTGAKIVTVKEALIMNRTKLQALAIASITIDASAFASDAEHVAEVRRSVEQYSSDELFNVILQRPTIVLTPTATNTTSRPRT